MGLKLVTQKYDSNGPDSREQVRFQPRDVLLCIHTHYQRTAKH